MARQKENIVGTYYVPAGRNFFKIKFKGVVIATGIKSTQERKVIQYLKQLNREYNKDSGILAEYRKSKSQKETLTNKTAFETHFLPDRAGRKEKTKNWYKESFSAFFPVDFALAGTIKRANKVISRLEYEIEKGIKSQVLSPGTCETYFRGVSSYISYLIEEDMLPVVPRMKRLRGMLEPNPGKPIRVFSYSEIDILLKHFRAKALTARNKIRDGNAYLAMSVFIELQVLHGLREHEARELCWEDIQSDSIRITSKDGKRHQYVPTTTSTHKALNRLPRKAGERRIFYSWNQGSASRLRKMFYDGMKECGVSRENRSFHELRKTYISRLVLEIGTSISSFEVSQLARCSVRVIEEHYLKIPTERLREALRTVHRKIQEKTPPPPEIRDFVGASSTL